ncbi:MAG: aminotransferase class I/II-fold pyridoxal phosphate-dependent enzyme [Candidatus Eisenbacteria bacterium]|nr:aminotransferase class I/II-fold pyridoxal phosphate-dependent enzyme [Candidatus Eisenbacteria bacterium]MCC7141096.1 aminotransferase class I/II-fold pyridoxal phosphate-dependent enzyme [Candidatus Eisenbacteria bacterium]
MTGAADFRSDTITRPTPAMRQAMAGAEVGDDVFGEDPTVRLLEEQVAARLGQEAGLFVPSGTMGNEIAVCVHTRPGDEVILEATAHIFLYEGGAPAFLAGVQCLPLVGTRGLFDRRQLEEVLHSDDAHYPRSRLVAFENTHNRGGGRVLPQAALDDLCALAHERGLATHLDGARLWNAAIATGRPLAELAHPFDSISVCFSKGLGAPVGSVLSGSRAFIAEARRVRKKLGGGMRQVGILAAGALHALEHHFERLAEDHARARRLAEALADLPGLCIDPASVETNIVILELTPEAPPPARWLDALRAEGVLAVAFGPRGIRLITHLDLDDAAIRHATSAFARVAPTLAPR